jgi:hypothetical protein
MIDTPPELPPLPRPHEITSGNLALRRAFTADQMRAYAREAIAIDRLRDLASRADSPVGEALTDEDWQAIADDCDRIIPAVIKQAVDRCLAARKPTPMVNTVIDQVIAYATAFKHGQIKHAAMHMASIRSLLASPAVEAKPTAATGKQALQVEPTAAEVTPSGELSDAMRLSLLNKLARHRGFENATKALASLPLASASPSEAHPPSRCCECQDCASYFDGNPISASDGAIYASEAQKAVARLRRYKTPEGHEHWEFVGERYPFFDLPHGEHTLYTHPSAGAGVPQEVAMLTEAEILDGWGYADTLNSTSGPPHRGLKRELETFANGARWAERVRAAAWGIRLKGDR